MHHSRYIVHSNQPPANLNAITGEIEDALAQSIQRVLRHPSSEPSVYTGLAGTTLMKWKVSSLIPRLEVPSTPASLLAVGHVSVPHSGSRSSFLETATGPATLILAREIRLLSESSTGDRGKQENRINAVILEDCARVLMDAVEAALDERLDDDGCEVLYGRAGLLYALLLLRSALNSFVGSELRNEREGSPIRQTVEHLCADQNIQALVNDIVKRGKVGAEEYKEQLDVDERGRGPPLMWSWHGKRYVGGVHGTAGILQMLISSPSNAVAPHWSVIIGTIDWLLAIQQPLGNWPSTAERHLYYASGGSATSRRAKRVSVEEGNEDALIQWCHGAPGVLILLSTLLTRCPHSGSMELPSPLQEGMVAALRRGGELVYTRGFLRKGLGLCHGVAGSVYALLAVSDALDHGQVPSSSEDTYWLSRAVHLAQLAINYRVLEREGEMHVPDEPYSLYEGVAGMCCAWAEVLARLEDPNRGWRDRGQRCGMPGYDDLLIG
ncbi:uncharacterized protein LAESUDRAFT_388250 [Laetiporus sulphureus 93-53]|uniref:Lanthionine synthetase C family protein n=1 Tax=Laetiporus sulphureus 93-53 TaxID=1314785 RepID=A0A165CGQ1_9APHY|nr:uncharacterized protein LAESUDRAFT_388250 [Laetiporus sulphureus 93-53]KZT02775.1 hypothetical protein LAESUDRAFT_388250 [Laetiporus sulphureus 93-53]